MARTQPVDFIDVVSTLLDDINKLGYSPTLVGGMALVSLGSPRVTKDFDFLIEEDARARKELIDAFYRHGFELVSKMDDKNNVLQTLKKKNVAYATLRKDPSKSASFYDPAISLRVDLLFDYPIPAIDVHGRSHRKKIRSHSLQIADTEDLITMKEIAVKNRKLATDVQDLSFLKKLGK